MIVQKLKKEEEDIFAVAERYYSILSVLNSLSLTKREIQLIGFISIKGSTSYKYLRDEFCEKYDSSSYTVNNIISKLKKENIFIKDDGKIKVNPLIKLNFTLPLQLQISLSYGQA